MAGGWKLVMELDGAAFGSIIFLLLCFAFARNQLVNLKIKPYTDWLQTFRAKRLQRRYPQYDEDIVHDFAVNDDWK